MASRLPTNHQRLSSLLRSFLLREPRMPCSPPPLPPPLPPPPPSSSSPDAFLFAAVWMHSELETSSPSPVSMTQNTLGGSRRAGFDRRHSCCCGNVLQTQPMPRFFSSSSFSSSSSSSFADDDFAPREDESRERDSLSWEVASSDTRLGQKLLPITSSASKVMLPSPDHVPAVDQQHEPTQHQEEEGPSSETVPFGEPTDIYIPVKAFFISRRINLKGLQDEAFLGTITARNHLILKWKDRPPGCPPITGKLDMQAMNIWSSTRYIVVFNYGSVVLFNFGENEEEECLDVIRNHCSEQCQEAKKDDFDIIVRPTLEGWCQGGHDKVLLKKLNTDNIRIVASILGQSIALDHYGRKVDALVTIFSDLNQKMEKTGTFTMKRAALFRVVATANTTLADVILRLGLLERSDAAWKDANYAVLWEFLREEYELDERFESFDFKLEIIQHNVRFFLEVLQNRKSDTLEWIIILLIAGEICVSLYEILHGSGVL